MIKLFLQSTLSVFIIVLAVLAGLLGGAKIISNGIIEANRFQFVDVQGELPKFFDTATGLVYEYEMGNECASWGTNSIEWPENKRMNIFTVMDWVKYSNWTKKELKKWDHLSWRD
tara:strand:- start:265 stop:609 length:345 start_codon:yes stop_codon:yes gene_type:complete